MRAVRHGAGPAGALLAALLVGAPLAAQTPVRYEVDLPNAAHHEARITAVFRSLSPEPLRVAMSRSSPGRYALHEFAKNVYEVEATDGSGRALEVRRTAPWEWTVAGHDGTVRFDYTLYADRADGTYSGIDASHAHLNMPATFVWAHGLDDRPHEVSFRPPEDARWRAATQLQPTGEPLTFRAPDRDYFLDSPTELSEFAMREWPAGPPGAEQTIRLAVHHAGEDADVDAYAELVARVVEEMAAVFGELPAFDYGDYTFIAGYLPWVSGDGMEHRNSTILTSTGGIGTHADRLDRLGTVAHEFFHAWNMERIRAADLEPFDFTGPNMTGTLWFGEGFTSYYDDLVIHRAGLTDAADYVHGLGGGLSAVVNSPARSFRGPAEMSRQALYVDAATWLDSYNTRNTFISYYTYGAVIGLGLDLLLRDRYGVTLDDYMQAVWQRHGTTGVGYTLGDLETVLGELSDPAFAADFFDRHIHAGELPDYETLLGRAGVLLRPAAPERATLGPTALRYEGGAAIVAEPTTRGTPLHQARIARGDRILRIGGRVPVDAGAVADILEAHDPGDRLEILFEQRGEVRSATVTLATDPGLETVLYEEAGRAVTPAMSAFRADWLGSRRTAALPGG